MQKVKTALSENHCSRVSVTTYAENKLRGTSYCTYTVNTPPFPSNPGRPVETWNCTRRSGWWADQYWTQSRVSQGHDSWRPDMCHGKKPRSKILKVPCQVYISGSWVPKGPRQVCISGSWVPKVPRQVLRFRDPGFPRSHVQYIFQDPGFPRSHVRYLFQDPEFPRSHDKYNFQDPESPRSHNLESPRSHKYTFQDPESPRSHDK